MSPLLFSASYITGACNALTRLHKSLEVFRDCGDSSKELQSLLPPWNQFEGFLSIAHYDAETGRLSPTIKDAIVLHTRQCYHPMIDYDTMSKEAGKLCVPFILLYS